MVQPRESTPRLRELLIGSGLVSQRQIDEALEAMEKRGGKLAETLIDLGYLNEAKLEKLISGRPGVPSIDLSRYTVVRELCALIPQELVDRHQVFPIDKMGKLLTVGMVMPIDAAAIAELESATGLRIKSVYCRPDHVRGAIDKYYHPDGWMRPNAPSAPKKDAPKTDAPKAEAAANRAQGPSAMIRIAKLLREIDELPSLPETVEKTKAALQDENVAISEVIAIIDGDPSVSAKLIRLANSSMNAIANRVDSAGAAVKLLGLRETYNVVLASTILNFAEGAKAFDFRRFWEEALFATSAVRGLGAVMKMRPAPALYTAALLHDIGRFALAHAVPEDYAKIDAHLTGSDLIRSEEDIFGLSHPEAAFVLGYRWDLPEEIVVPIRYHHNPAGADPMQKEASIVGLAGYLAETFSSKRKLKPDTDFADVQAALDTLNLSPAQLIEAYREAVVAFVA